MMARNLRLLLIGLITLLAGGLLWQELSGPAPLPEPVARQDHWALPELAPLEMPPLTAYEPMLQRPLFNPDRKPVELPDPSGTAGQPGEAAQETPPQPLEVVLRGVILLPEHRIALLEDSKGKQKLRVREGEPLKGELGQWTLKALSPRSALFVQQGTGREEEVKLQVYGKPLPAASGGKTARNGNGKKKAGKTTGKSEKKKSASGLDPEEIRRKVAERRARLRAEAARKRAQKKSKQE